MGRFISVGACIGLIVVVMILILGQTRVGFAMARDGLLPRGLAKVHPRFGTPYIFTIITGVAVAIIGGLVDLATLANLVSIGTLFAFVLVSVGVVVLRRTRPDLPRAFRTPAVPVVARPRGADVRLPDAEPDRRDLGAVRDLDGHRLRRVLRLRALPQPGRHPQPGGQRARRAEAWVRGAAAVQPTNRQNGCPDGSASTYRGSSGSSVRSRRSAAPSASACTAVALELRAAADGEVEVELQRTS